MFRHIRNWWIGVLLCGGVLPLAQAADMPWVQVAKTTPTFVLSPGDKPFVVWGFNYDHDSQDRLLEDYWESEWASVEAHFQQMKQLGANAVRIHLQFDKFMSGPETPNVAALDRLAKLVALAEQHQLYLNLTGLGHKRGFPTWYDNLPEADRWTVHARFWKAISGRVAHSPAIFCYDLMHEPLVPVRRAFRNSGTAFEDKNYLQYITRDQMNRPRPEIAAKWIKQLVTAIREVDQRHLITVGLVDWSLDRPGLTSGFVPDKVAADLDFLSVHLYPERRKQQAALETLAGFAAAGKPVVIEETYPSRCSILELLEFLDLAKSQSAGTFSFYWGQPPAELRKSRTLTGLRVSEWLEAFESRSKGPRTK